MIRIVEITRQKISIYEASINLEPVISTRETISEKVWENDTAFPVIYYLSPRKLQIFNYEFHFPSIFTVLCSLLTNPAYQGTACILRGQRILAFRHELHGISLGRLFILAGIGTPGFVCQWIRASCLHDSDVAVQTYRNFHLSGWIPLSPCTNISPLHTSIIITSIVDRSTNAYRFLGYITDLDNIIIEQTSTELIPPAALYARSPGNLIFYYHLRSPSSKVLALHRRYQSNLERLSRNRNVLRQLRQISPPLLSSQLRFNTFLSNRVKNELSV